MLEFKTKGKIKKINHLVFTFSEGLIDGTGGAEKVLCTQANYFDKLGYRVTLLTNDSKRGVPFYPINKSVRLININESVKANSLDKHYQFYAWRQLLDILKPDVVITSCVGDVDLVTRLGSLNCPIVNVCNGRPDYDFCAGYGFHRSPEWVQRLKTLYYRIDGGNVFFDSYKEYLPKGIKGIIHTIPNVVPNLPKKPRKITKKIISVGTIDPNQKRQHLAIKGFKKWDKKGYELHFYGSIRDLEYYDSLIKLVDKLHLNDKVFFHKPEKDINKIYDNADIFLSTSKFEGFPLALTEAMAKGLVCVGYSKCSGTNELLKDPYGILYDNLDDLPKKLNEAVEMASFYGKNAREFVKQFSEDHVMELWHNLIKEVCINYYE